MGKGRIARLSLNLDALEVFCAPAGAYKTDILRVTQSVSRENPYSHAFSLCIDLSKVSCFGSNLRIVRPIMPPLH